MQTMFRTAKTQHINNKQSHLYLELRKNLIQVLYHFNPHSISSPDDGLANTLKGHVLTIRIRLLNLGNLVNMFDGQRGGDHVTWTAATRLDAGSLLQVPRNGGRLHNELEGVVFEGSYGDGHGGVGLVLLGSSVEVLAEGHQIEPVLTQGWTHWRSWSCSSGRHSQPDGGCHRPPG